MSLTPLEPLRRRPLLRWISLLILVLAALAPGVSKCLHTELGAALAHVAAGYAHDDGLPTLEHCGFCALHAINDVLPVLVPTWVGTHWELWAPPATALNAPPSLARPRPASRDPPGL
jgi:hypothetical protein